MMIGKNSFIINICGIVINLLSAYLILGLIFSAEKLSQKLITPIIFEIKTPFVICISLAIGVTASHLLAFTPKNNFLTKLHILSILLLSYLLAGATIAGVVILVIETSHVSKYLIGLSADKTEIYIILLVPIISLFAFVSALRGSKRSKI